MDGIVFNDGSPKFCKSGPLGIVTQRTLPVTVSRGHIISAHAQSTALPCVDVQCAAKSGERTMELSCLCSGKGKVDSGEHVL